VNTRCLRCGSPLHAAGICPNGCAQREPGARSKPLLGWMCPVCGGVYAPWVDRCHVCLGRRETWGSTSTNPENPLKEKQ